jgi:hypothetical protein
VHHIFRQHGIHNPDSQEWTSERTVDVVHLESLPTKVDEHLFALDLPEGTLVNDGVNSKRYVVGGLKQEGRPPELPNVTRLGGWRWLVIANSGIAAIIIAVITRRWMRKRAG